MGFFDRMLRGRQPLCIDDPLFGRLVFMEIRHDESESYWEGEWTFPPTGTPIFIGLPGGKDGPLEESRAFLADLSGRFADVLEAVRPVLDEVFQQWLGRSINDDIWSDVVLGGLALEAWDAAPREWEISFETTGKKWLGIAVPFVGNAPGVPVVDT